LLRLPTSTITIIGIGIFGTLALAALSGLVVFGLLVKERILLQRAKRKRAERDAEVTSIVVGDQVFINDMNHDAYWRSSHLDPRYYANSKNTYSEPSDLEIESWRQFNAPKTIEKTLQLPAVIEQEKQFDLMAIFTQLSQSYAIIAGQRVGKTYQAMQIANYWLSRGCKPIVIGPKWDRGEWAGCTLFGGELNYNAVKRGLKVALRLAKDRHANSMPHDQHSVQAIFFDDWTSIKKNIGEDAEYLVTEATTLFASVNIIVYFMIHLDTANAWGVDKIGAALKNNFVKLFIEPGYDENGLIDRRYNKGYLMRPGETKKDRIPIKLFNGMSVTRLSDQEQIVSSMLASGESRSAIAVRLFGHAGGNQLRDVDKIIERMSS